MTTLNTLDPKTVADRLKAGAIALIDIRDRDEFAREHIEGAISMPVSSIDEAGLNLEPTKPAVFHCKSGMRTQANCAKLAAHVTGDAFILEGGLDAWKAEGLPTARDASAPLALNRQVQIAAGGLVLIGALLGLVVNPAYLALSAFVGAGLVFAGVSGWCGMANLLALMPWNKAMRGA
ncbi:MAG: rhodanese family protein [Pseudomonadota bacterium]